MKKKALMFFLAATMIVGAYAGSPITTNAKTLEETIADLQKSTDKIHDIMDDLNNNNDSSNGASSESSNSSESGKSDETIASYLPVPKFDYVTPGLGENEYYGILKNHQKGMNVEFKVYNKKGDEMCSDIAGGTICTAKAIKPGVYYFIARTRELGVENGQSVYRYSKWGSKKWFITDPWIDQVAVKNSLKANSVKLKWDKVPGATKYEIYVSNDSKKGFKKVGSTKKTTYNLTKGSNGKKISFKNSKYIKVYAVTSVDGKTIKSKSDGCMWCKVI